jgi:prepilin peptidase CpaA
VALGALGVAVVFDLRTRQIPDTISLFLLALALAATGFHWHRVGWLDMAGGVAIGLSLGLLLFRAAGFGGGDVKLVVSLGAILGARGELGVLFYTAIFGGLLALIARLRREREYAYAPAIALGLLAFIVRGYFA